jgi:cbb3-type cytochrome oxidase subunit 3
MSVDYQGPLDPIHAGKATVTYTVSNTGNTALGGLQAVYVSGLFGSRSTAALLPKIQLLVPGYSVKETVEVKGVFPEVRETAHVSVRPLYITGSVGPASGLFQASLSFWAIPWTLIAIIVVVILLVVGWIYWRRRRRQARDAQAAPQKPGGQDSAVKQEPRPDDVPVSTGSAGRQAAGHEPNAKDPTPVASDEKRG